MLHWIKFNVVGVVGFALQSAALFVLTHIAYPISYLAATTVAVELAVLNNFVWHQRWTWSDRPSTTKKETMRRLAKFNFTTGLVSIVGNLVLLNSAHTRMFGRQFLLFDVAGVISAVAMAAILIFSSIKNTHALYELERLP